MSAVDYLLLTIIGGLIVSGIIYIIQLFIKWYIDLLPRIFLTNIYANQIDKKNIIVTFTIWRLPFKEVTLSECIGFVLTANLKSIENDECKKPSIDRIFLKKEINAYKFNNIFPTILLKLKNTLSLTFSSEQDIHKKYTRFRIILFPHADDPRDPRVKKFKPASANVSIKRDI